MIEITNQRTSKAHFFYNVVLKEILTDIPRYKNVKNYVNFTAQWGIIEESVGYQVFDTFKPVWDIVNNKFVCDRS